MNVDDISSDVIPTDFSKHDRLDLIFMRQHELMKKYIPIEVANDLCHSIDCPIDIHDKYGQARLKDFFWRITEELTEAAEANRIHPELRQHVLEELADALHFLVETYLLAGMKPSEFVQSHPTHVDKLAAICEISERCAIEEGCFRVIYQLGLASNCLKNRPWKQSHQLTDVKAFRRFLGGALHQLIGIFTNMELTADEIFRIYFKKSEVNKFRQRSNY